MRANGIVPGPIDGTEGFKRMVGEAYPADLLDSLPLQRFGTVDDIGQAAIFLASPLARSVTGVVLPVDGGLTLIGSALQNRHLGTLPRRARGS